ncbi:MAG: DUF4270 family protein [Saprospiraceae bacterium]|nr:DUF4270 family protein [Saprospiraceae bacterium]
MKNFFIASISLFTLLIVGACNKSSQLGADLFSNDKLNLTFSDTLITVVAQTENPDSVLALNALSSGGTFVTSLPLGKMYDPVFGVTDARIISNFYYNSTARLTLDAGLEYELLGINLVMAYKGTETYGDTTAEQKIGIYRFDGSESLAGDNLRAFSNKKYKTETKQLGSLTFRPTPSTYVRRDTNYFRPHIVIPLDSTFGKSLLDTAVHSLYNANGGDIRKFFRGFEIRTENTTNGLISFNSADDSSGIYLHYKKRNDTTKLVYRFPFSATTYPYYNHDYAQGSINKFFNGKKTASGDSLLFAQGMAGANIKLEFPNLKKQLGTAVVNRAELELTIVEDSIDKYQPIERFILSTGSGAPIADLLRSSNTAVAEYGGIPVYEAGVRRYKCNLSQHLQDMLYGRAGTVLYLIPDNTRGSLPDKQSTTRRVVLYGTKHSKYRTKLNLYYTKP